MSRGEENIGGGVENVGGGQENRRSERQLKFVQLHLNPNNIPHPE